jgi:hypothetical protein
MKNRLLLCATAVAALTVGPAFATDLTYNPPLSAAASPTPSSGGALYAPTSIVGDISAEFGGFSETGASGAFGDIYGRINIPMGNDWNFEAEALGFDSFSYFTEFAAVGHLYKDLPTAAVGAFAGFGTYSGSYSDWMVGVEGQSYASGTGAIGAEVHVAGNNYSGHWAQATLFGAHFFNPDTDVYGKVGGWAGWDGAASGVFGGIGLQKRITGTPFSGYVEVDAQSDSSSTNQVSAKIGLTLNADPAGTTLLNHSLWVPWYMAGAL